MKRLMGVFILILTVLTVSFAVAEDIPDEQFEIYSLHKNSSDYSKELGISFSESFETISNPTLLYGYSWKDRRFDVVSFCSSVTDKACESAEILQYMTYLAPCRNLREVNCIQSFYAKKLSNGKKIQGKFERSVPSTVAKTFLADKKYDVPPAENPGYWTIPGVTHFGKTNQYAVLVSRLGEIHRKTSIMSPREELQGGIFPISMVSGSNYDEIQTDIKEGSDGLRNVYTSYPGRNHDVCALAEKNLCGLRQSFPIGYSFGVTVKLPTKVSGWLHGRIHNPNFSFTKQSYGYLLEIEGSPLVVPTVAGFLPFESVTDSLKSVMGTDVKPGKIHFPGSSGDYAMNVLTEWTKSSGDKSVASPSYWTFYTLRQYELTSYESCVNSGSTAAGFVTTNSTTYAAGPPKFDSDSQSLDYKVASPHFLKDGSVFKGEYNLYIDSKVARCIYQFSNAPVSATISILNENGVSQVATTSVQEKEGWLRLSAYGFTFSNPTLRIKLSQAKPLIDSINSASKGTSITCIKGKTSKKVTGSKPLCPAGFKKK